jgi:hypothetical protein
MKLISFIASLLLVTHSIACSENGSTGFFPENNLRIPVSSSQVSGISEQEFNHIIERYEKIYIPIAQESGGNLSVDRKWKDDKVNASATRMFKSWKVNMYGGLARHQDITADGFAMVLCHEIGHHLGGAPKITSPIQRWASNEGQSDYFAGLKCLRKGFLGDDNEAIVSKMDVPPEVTMKCREAYKTPVEQAICVRISMAGDSLAAVMASIRNAPRAKFDTPDQTVVTKTYHNHPAAQCRLDTYFQGALCDRPLDEELSDKDEVIGSCHPKQGDTLGLRPLCWFKPIL